MIRQLFAAVLTVVLRILAAVDLLIRCTTAEAEFRCRHQLRAAILAVAFREPQDHRVPYLLSAMATVFAVFRNLFSAVGTRPARVPFTQTSHGEAAVAAEFAAARNLSSAF